MKFNFKKKNKDVKLGDVLISPASGYHYMVVRDYIAPNHIYRLLCLDDADMMITSFDHIEDMVNYHFNEGQHEVIPREDLILSNSN